MPNTQNLVTNIYAIKDKKTNLFDVPFAAHNNLFSKRKFIMDVNQPGTMLNQFSNDFELWYLGTFDNALGTFAQQAELILEGKEIFKDEISDES